jgi:hypothetical protein
MIVFLLFGLLTPRFIMVLLWLFSDYLSRGFDGSWLLPLLGFFLLPTTTLCYAFAQNSMDGVRGLGLVLVIVGLLFDLGIVGGSRGRGVFKRDRAVV